jgi:hypothetical protein
MLARSVWRIPGVTPGDVRQATHDRPVGRVDPGGPDANQHLAVADLGLVDVPEFQNIG